MDVKRLFETVEEDASPMQATINGKFPDWLKGTFLRVGPGRYELGDWKMRYWLDGYSFLSAFQIEGPSKITYQRRFLQSEAVKKGLQAKKPLFTEFGTRAFADPSKNMLSRMVNSLVPGDLTDNCNLNVYQCNGHTLAATETCFSRVIDPITLETKDKVDINKAAGINVSTCHPHIDMDGNIYNIGCNFFSGLKYTVYKTPPHKAPSGANVLDGTVTVNTLSPSWKTAYGFFHSFGMTTNYLILVEQPCLVNSVKLVTSKAKGKSFKECLDWTPDEKTRFIIIEKSTGQKLKTHYIAPAFFFLHHINAYEDSDHLIIDIITFKSSDVLEAFSLEYLRSGNSESSDSPVPKRFVLPLQKVIDSGPATGNLVTLKYTKATAEKQKDSVYCVPETLFEEGAKAGFDLPAINYKRCNGRPYRYVYGTGFLESGLTKHSLCKGDLQTKKLTLWNAGENYFCGEPVFIEAPNATDEDDGVIIAGACSSKPDKQDYMVVLDAKSFKELGRASVPVRITTCTHNTFIPK